jgi:hypothetical protein
MIERLPFRYRQWVARREDRGRKRLSLEEAEEEYEALLYGLEQAREVSRLLRAASDAVPRYHLRGRSRGMRERLKREWYRADDTAGYLRRRVESFSRFLYWKLKQEGRVDVDYLTWLRDDRARRLQQMMRDRAER